MLALINNPTLVLKLFKKQRHYIRTPHLAAPILINSPLIISCLLLVVITRPVNAFDDDVAINDVNLSVGNFLDINAYQFRKSLDLQWYDSLNGWRISGGSLDGDRLFVQSQLKLHHALSSFVNVRLQYDQELFFARKPSPYPSLEIEVYPFKSNLGFVAIGTPHYDKRQSDLGAAIIWGRRPWNFLRLAWVKGDVFYNKKNDFDDSYYEEEPETIKLQSAYKFTPKLKFRLKLENARPLAFILAGQESRFTHRSLRYDVTLDYEYTGKDLMGMAIRGFNTDKSLNGVNEGENQSIDFVSMDVYWLSYLSANYEITVGTQYDGIFDELRDDFDNIKHRDYSMQTWQLYSSMYRAYAADKAWDIGVYAGWVWEQEKFLENPDGSSRTSNFQAKLRTSWEYHSLSKTSSLIFHISFNLDDLIDDPTDGGGISFQTVF